VTRLAWFVGLALGTLLLGCGVVATSEEETSEDPEKPTEVAAYIVPWDDVRGLDSWKSGARGVLAAVSPVWLTPTDDGGIILQEPGATADVVAQASAFGADVVPSVSNFVDGRWDGELVSRLVGDPSLRERHVRAITRATQRNGWDGVDIDYESLPPKARDAFSLFLAELGDSLRSDGAFLTVTVQAKTSDGPEGLWASQDWAAIGRAADRVRVMAYDHAWSTSEPGSVAPLPWVREVMAYAVEQIPPAKVELGIGAYGYDWVGSQGEPLSWAEAQEVAREHGVDVRWDAETASSWFTYEDENGREHTVWFEDARSARLKVAAALGLGVSNVVVWQLGGADPRLWSVLAPGR
jgi:spore germination protein YaaH